MTVRLKSVTMATDNTVIPELLEIHLTKANPLILDVTYNRGVMWQGVATKLGYRLVTMDINPALPVMVHASFSQLPFANGVFDVIVFDPPHLPVAGGSLHSSRIWHDRYGITGERGQGRDGDNVSEMFLPFLLEAKRVLVPGGIILAKIADLVHNHRQQWQHVDLILAAQYAGLTACDMLIKVDPKAGRLTSGRWQQVKHLRKAHVFWLVIRNSDDCEAPAKPVTLDHTPVKQPNQLSLF